MSKINKVLYNVDQTSDTVAAERRMARKNIGLDEVIGHATTADDTGIAPLGENGLVPAEYLPSFVNNVVDGYFYQGKFYRDSAHTTEISPDENTTYVDITTADLGVAYRYSTGSGEYFSITNQNAFGVVSDGTNSIHADKPIDLLTVVGNNGITTTVADTRGQEQNGSDKLTIGHSNSITADDIGETSPTTTISNTFNLPWASFDGQGHITATGSNAITIQNASTGGYGVTKLTSTPGSGETLAMTPKGVQTAIGNLNATVNSSGGSNVALTVTEASGVITGVSITRDNTAAATHDHGTVGSDGKVTTVAQTKNALLVTNSSNQITVGPTFGSATGDGALFLNKQGNWSGINEATASALGGIKIGYTKNATKYPVELSDGKAYVDVPCSLIKTMNTGLPPVETNISTLTLITDGRVKADSNTIGCLAPEPSSTEQGMVLKAGYTGSPARGFATWDTIREVPSCTQIDAGKVLMVNSAGNSAWDDPHHVSYDSGQNLTTTQKKNARININAVSQSQISDLRRLLYIRSIANATWISSPITWAVNASRHTWHGICRWVLQPGDTLLCSLNAQLIDGEDGTTEWGVALNTSDSYPSAETFSKYFTTCPRGGGSTTGTNVPGTMFSYSNGNSETTVYLGMYNSSAVVARGANLYGKIYGTTGDGRQLSGPNVWYCIFNTRSAGVQET